MVFIQEISGKKLKKAPIPWHVTFNENNQDKKLISIIRKKFVNLFGERINLSSKEIKSWGLFLFEKGIFWEFVVPRKQNWADWEFFEQKRKLMARPKGLEDYLKVSHYYIPKDLAMKMLVLGDLN